MAILIKTPFFEVEEGGCRQRPPSILWFGGSYSHIVVLTTSLTCGLLLDFRHLSNQLVESVKYMYWPIPCLIVKRY